MPAEDIIKKHDDEIKDLQVHDTKGEPMTVFKLRSETLNVNQGPVIVKTRNIAGETMIWNHSQFGIWGTAKWGSTPQMSFILGHAIAGILGTSKLGSQTSSYTIVRILNPNNTFKEYFRTTTFKDSANTDADWDLTNTRLAFDDQEEAQSKRIALNDVTYKSAILTVTGMNLDRIKYYLSFDNGSNFEEVENNVSFTSSFSSSSGILWKATAYGNGNKFPLKFSFKFDYFHLAPFSLKFPITFGTFINNLDVNYSTI